MTQFLVVLFSNRYMWVFTCFYQFWGIAQGWTTKRDTWVHGLTYRNYCGFAQGCMISIYHFFCWRTPISKLCQCLFLSIVLLVTRWLGDSKIFWKVLLPRRPTTFWRPRNRSLSLRFPQSSDVRCSDSAMLSPESQRTYFFGKFEWPNRQQMMEC